MNERWDKFNFRDSFRGLLFIHRFDRAVRECESHLSSFQPGLDTLSILQPLITHWALAIDDMVCPVVEEELRLRRFHKNLASSGPTAEDAYRNLFLEKDALSPWVKDVPKHYPYLQELVSKYLDNRVKNFTKCIQSLRQDWEALGDTEWFNQGEIKRVLPTSSDPHCGGKAALLLEFSSGSKLLFKPFGGECGLLFSRIVDLLHGENKDIDLRSMRVLVKDCYSWVEFIPHQPCNSVEEAGSYYNRAGMLVALCEFLGFVDGHQWNLIAQGQYPVLVDCEAFFQPKSLNSDWCERLLATGLIQTYPKPFSSAQPGWLAAFQHLDNEPESNFNFSILHERTDMFTLLVGTTNPDSSSLSIPRVGNEPQYLRNHVTDFVKGYTVVADTLRKLETATSFIDLLDEAKKVEIRIILRPTLYYAKLQRALYCPKFYRCKKDAMAAMTSLLKLRSDLPDSVINAEVHDLSENDIPAFYATAGEAAKILKTSYGSSLELLNVSLQSWCPLEALKLFSEENVLRKTSFLQEKVLPLNLLDFQFDTKTCMECALSLAQEVMAMFQHPELQKSMLQKGNLYSGLGGTALFLGAVNHAVKEINRSCPFLLEPFLDLLVDPTNSPWDSLGGAFSGPLADIYVLVVLGNLSSRFDLVDEAYRMCLNKITPALIQQQTTYDIIGGSSGALLVLLCLYESLFARGKSKEAASILGLAVTCGEHLISTFQTNGCLGWPAFDGRTWTGLSHGLAGQVFALSRLANACGDQRFREFAVSVAAREDTFFLTTKQNWQDLRDGENKFTFSWCYGSPGICLSRAKVGMSSPVALDAFSAMLLDLEHNYDISCCCGAGGFLDIALELSLEESTITKIANTIVSKLWHKGTAAFETDDRYSFMKGACGVGYVLLRAFQRDKFPSILAVESGIKIN